MKQVLRFIMWNYISGSLRGMLTTADTRGILLLTKQDCEYIHTHGPNKTK